MNILEIFIRPPAVGSQFMLAVVVLGMLVRTAFLAITCIQLLSWQESVRLILSGGGSG